MRILLLAPQPFYSDRGTPIAVRLLLESLSKRGHEIDVLTYAEGRNITIDRVQIQRIFQPEFTYGIQPGFSWKKIICDFLMAVQAFKLVLSKKYDYLHAVEESVFIALVIKLILAVPYVYDMDSSLPQQLSEKYPWLKPILPLGCFLEGLVVKNSFMVLTVCESLALLISQYKPRKVFILTDIATD